MSSAGVLMRSRASVSALTSRRTAARSTPAGQTSRAKSPSRFL